jgi:hypothetical protein
MRCEARAFLGPRAYFTELNDLDMARWADVING